MKSVSANVSVVSSSTVLVMFDAVGRSFTAVTVTVTVAAADSTSTESVTVKVKVAVPFQSAAGSNRSVPRSAASIESPALTSASGSSAFKVPWAASGRVTILTDFSLWPSGSLNA